MKAIKIYHLLHGVIIDGKHTNNKEINVFLFLCLVESMHTITRNTHHDHINYSGLITFRENPSPPATKAKDSNPHSTVAI